MNQINILVVVDALGAKASGSLMDNVYVVDSNKYLGSWREGSDALHTVCQDGQKLVWSVSSISPDNDVEISGFSGPMVSERICNPAKQGAFGESSWEGRVETRGGIGQYPYAITVTIDGAPMAFSPYIKVV